MSVARLVTALVAFSVSAAARTYSYQTIAYPNSTATYLYDVNSDGAAVGYIFDASLNTYGVIYSNGEFRKVELGPPGGATYLSGINDNQEIIGQYWDPSFTYITSYQVNPGGTVASLTTSPITSYSVYDEVILYRNNEGVYLGSADADNLAELYVEYGFLHSGGRFELIEKYKDGTTAVTGLNNKNEVVGYTALEYAQNSSDGFLYSNGTFTTIDYPGHAVTSLRGINDYGVIVGTYVPTNIYPEAYPRGFLYDHGVFSSIAFPGSIGTQPMAINNNGVIVGFYWAADNFSASFIATPN